ncbi:hypothetical protein FS842_001537 [Serendipita sp. 407]|nr:hypothetical protein FRC20_003175 [Serendipita sp. 405]KAG9044261.1 hypothetical protein FS842_001537 [Serendipita sp. 407]
MGLRDTFKFDEIEYIAEVINSTDERLYIEHERHSFLLLTNYIGTFGCLGLSVGTGGITLAGTAYLGRQVYVCARKAEIIRDEMKARGLTPNVKPISADLGHYVISLTRLLNS